jgi:DNA-binding XRE family transcriptional regulator
MEKAEVLARLERKLNRDKASVLTDAEVRLLAAEVRALFGPTFAEVFGKSSGRLENTVRWLSLKVRCEQARAARGMSLKEAALELKVPKYRLAAIEAGTFGELKPDVARQYFRFLGIEPWVRRWSRANRDLAKRAGIAPDVRA